MIKYVFIAILVLELINCTREPSKPVQTVTIPRNVYIITASGTRPDHLSSYMYQSIQTVGLDYFAYDGIRFTRAFSTSSDSLPAHLSILTGLDPTHNSIFETYQYFQSFTSTTLPSIENLPKMLRDKGCRTAAFAADPELRSFVLRSGWFDTTYAGDSVLPTWQPSCDSNQIRLQATEFSLINKSKPHFVFMNFFEPTPPYEPPEPYNKHYPTHSYDGEIAALDEQISHFIHVLKESGIFENSILIFTAPYAENPEGVGRAGSLDDDNLKIPLMIVAPGLLPRHENYAAAVSLTDVYPTIAALLNWGEVSRVDGKTLFQKNNNQQVHHDFLFGGSFFPTLLGTDPYWYGWNDGWRWMSNSGVVKREEGLTDSSDPKLLLKNQKLLSEAVGARTSTGAVHAIPEGSILQLEEALIAARKGKLDDALKSISDQAFPQTSSVLNFRAELEDGLGDIDDSIATLKKATQTFESPELVLRLVNLKIKKGDVAAAEVLLKKYHGNMSYDIYSITSIVDRISGKLDQAQADIDMAFRLNPRSAEAHHQQGLVYFARGEFARAEVPLRKSLELQPENKNTMLDLAATLAKLGKRDEVRRLCAA
ncbi:sulfatase-like hydrolase/transferase, partial [bacterium]|nr:sulfatase-like hydrolase/transferase [bacterium]